MATLSIIIPYYHEPFLDKTITSITENTFEDAEILPIEGSEGLRGAINEGLSKATGKFIMKCDAHCLFGKHFDKVLTEDCHDDWLMVPRRYSINWKDGLDGAWSRSEEKPYIDYHFLSNPGLFAINWTNKKSDLLIDDTMAFQGSCWFANREYFMEKVGYLKDAPCGNFVAEHLEIGLKYWLGDGAVKVDKNTWYAHLHKNKQSYTDGVFVREYKTGPQFRKYWQYISDHWAGDREEGMQHKLSWLIDKFKPVPTWE